MKTETQSGPTGGIRCWNGFVGCEKIIYGPWWNSAVCIWEAHGYNPAVKLCNDCANFQAEKWGVVYSDLDLVYTAMQVGRAGKNGKEATADEVYGLLKRLGAKFRTPQPAAQVFESQLPKGDR